MCGLGFIFFSRVELNIHSSGKHLDEILDFYIYLFILQITAGCKNMMGIPLPLYSCAAELWITQMCVKKASLSMHFSMESTVRFCLLHTTMERGELGRKLFCSWNLHKGFSPLCRQALLFSNHWHAPSLRKGLCEKGIWKSCLFKIIISYTGRVWSSRTLWGWCNVSPISKKLQVSCKEISHWILNKWSGFFFNMDRLFGPPSPLWTRMILNWSL